MSRRPPGHVASPRTCRNLFIAVLLVPWTHAAHAQHEHQPLKSHPPPELDVSLGSPLNLVPPSGVDRPANPPSVRHKIGVTSSRVDADADDQHTIIRPPHDASALHDLALDPHGSVRASSLPGGKDLKGSGPTSPQHNVARSLKDWEMEDFVLLATVDGDLYASDRTTGAIRWHLQVEQPMVETKHYRTNQSKSSLEDDYRAVDHYIWVVEPHRDGGLYMWIPNDDNLALIEMPYTMKTMVERTPLQDKDQDILYNGEKRTTLVTLDAATGRVLKWFGPTGAQVNDMDSCLQPNALTGAAAAMDRDECSSMGTITLGRTEYRVDVRHTNGDPIATLKYSEWGPNTFDDDLIQQHRVAKDNHYITSQHDGLVYGLDYNSPGSRHPAFSQKLDTPVARVFDVVRRWDAGSPSTHDLAVLPQPPPPADHDSIRHVVFINQTETGSWYAMSGSRYPLIHFAPTAPIHSEDGGKPLQPWEEMNDAQISKALIGIHPLPTAPVSDQSGHRFPTPRLTLDGPVERLGEDHGPTADGQDPGHLMSQARRFPQAAADKIVELVSNPAAILLLLALLVYYQHDVRRWFRGKAKQLGKVLETHMGHKATTAASALEHANERDARLRPFSPAQTIATRSEPLPSVPEEVKTDVLRVAAQAIVAPPLFETVDKDLLCPAVGAVDPYKGNVSPEDGTPGENGKKKKAHRGRRGGIKHRKGRDKRELSMSREDEAPQATVEEVVNKAKNIGLQPRLEPDIQTVTNDVEEISGPILRMGSLEVNEDQQLGTGSNGTVVFAGKWDGRDVAVKRMLIQFNDIASQETKLLRESDDHPNVIRYFAQQQRAAFLYIALELCEASLADVIQKPHMHRALAHAGERNMISVLYQITDGLGYLHSLRIVHRDLKPQNILVAIKKKRLTMLVSDFGLCKKLEGTNSSFGATTAHAAGTSGWRAPELLVDDNTPAPSGGSADAHSSVHSASGSATGLVGDPVGPNHRRVTRAIDIFSLGLVFFYVLTKGSHPFDCGDRYMREVNIRKGNYNLQPLDVLGDYAAEARDLIASMLSANPRRRPSAHEVMAHPFFWEAKVKLAFLCDVSDHFEKEPREPPSAALVRLEAAAPAVVRGDFLRHLPRDFVDSLGRQRKYTGARLLDLLRALRNKRNHYEDLPDALKKLVGPLPDGYLQFWTCRFPNLLLVCWNLVYELHWDENDRFRAYFTPVAPVIV